MLQKEINRKSGKLRIAGSSGEQLNLLHWRVGDSQLAPVAYPSRVHDREREGDLGIKMLDTPPGAPAWNWRTRGVQFFASSRDPLSSTRV